LLAFVEGLVFIAILAVALVYVWRKGDLEWVRAEDRG
jgi:NADH:ubiquinone oxidoreductase subunit 3 (subunit A)